MAETKCSSPAFFKILDDTSASTTEDSWLAIPPKFLQLYGAKLATRSKIVGPDDATWNATIRGETFSSIGLRAGWANFVIAYGLKAGDLIVMRLHEDSTLKAEIFGGKTSVSRLLEADETPALEARVRADPISTDAAALEAPSQPKRPRGRPPKVSCTSPVTPVADNCGGTKRKLSSSTQKVPSPFSRRRAVTDAERESALARAGAFRSKNPFSINVMKDSHVYRGFWMGLKSDFSRTYLPDDTTEMVLLDSSGATWPAKWLGKRMNSGVSGGWRKFSIDHRIEEGDVCVFEVIDGNKKKPVVKVHIFRVVELLESRESQGDAKKMKQEGMTSMAVTVIDNEDLKPGLSEDEEEADKRASEPVIIEGWVTHGEFAEKEGVVLD